MKKRNGSFLLILLIGLVLFSSNFVVYAAIPQGEPQPEFTPEMPQYKIFVKFGNLVGEAVEIYHGVEFKRYYKGWCNAEAFSHKVVFKKTKGKMERMKRPQMNPFEITKMIDKVTPKLNEAVIKGTKFPNIIVDLVRTDGNHEVFMSYIFKNAILVSSSVSGNPSREGTIPKETIKFLSDEMTWMYIPVSATGKPAGFISTKVIFN